MLLRLISICLALLFAAAAHAQMTPLVRNGAANAVIIISEKAGGCIPTAAGELQTYLEKITGQRLAIEKAAADSTMPLAELTRGRTALLVGESIYTRQLGIDSQALAPEGFVIKSFPAGIAIVGRDEDGFNVNYDKSTASAGTLYGVYRFLEELGCRWFYPDPQYEVVPKRPTLEVPALDIADQPYFEYRFAYGNVEWRRKAGYGGTVDPWRTRHTFESARVAKRYGESHPKLVEEGFHFTHPGVMDLVIAEARAYLGRSMHAGRKYFLVVPKDAYAGCGCSTCAPLRTPHRGPTGELSDIIGQAVVQTAHAVQDLPGKIVYCAYEKYRLPPERIEKLPENVAVLMAVHRTAFHDPQVREREWEIIHSWHRLRPERFYFCRYYEGFLKVTPSFAPRLIAADIQRMKQARESNRLPIGGEMNFGAVAADHPYAWWFCLNEYVTAKMLWNPDLDVDALLADYYQAFFGPAAVPMEKLFTRLEALYNDPKERHLYSVAVIEELQGYETEARALAAGTEWESRVGYISTGLEALEMMKRKLTSGAADETPPSPDVHFALDEGSGTVTRAGELEAKIAAAAWAEGVSGSALRFDGAASAVHLPGVNLAGTDYSYELWIKPEAVTFDRAQYLLGPSSWERQVLALRGSQLMMMHRFQGGSHFGTRARIFAKAAEFKPGEWHHVAATFSTQDGMALYINGVLVAMDPSLTRASEYGIAFIGAGGRSGPDALVDHFKGVIDDVRIYRRQLSPQAIRAGYQERKPR